MSHEEQYEFPHRRGMAVVIVNGNFKDKSVSERKCAQNDLAMSKKSLEDLGFEVKDYFNQTASEMILRIKTGKNPTY